MILKLYGKSKIFGKDVPIFFNEKSGDHLALQTLGTIDELYDSVPEVEEKFSAFSNDLLKKICRLSDGEKEGKTIEFKKGETKERERAEQKIAADYDGKATLISDIIRGKIIFSSPETISNIIKILNPRNKQLDPLLKKHGVECVVIANHFEEPKFQTGYRCINSRIAIPIEGTDEKHVVELQFTHEALEQVYEKTHYHMREAQKISAQYEHTEMPNDIALKKACHYAVCRFHNGAAAKEAGLDNLLSDPTGALSEEQTRSLSRMMKHLTYDY